MPRLKDALTDTPCIHAPPGGCIDARGQHMHKCYRAELRFGADEVRKGGVHLSPFGRRTAATLYRGLKGKVST